MRSITFQVQGLEAGAFKLTGSIEFNVYRQPHWGRRRGSAGAFRGHAPAPVQGLALHQRGQRHQLALHLRHAQLPPRQLHVLGIGLLLPGGVRMITWTVLALIN